MENITLSDIQETLLAVGDKYYKGDITSVRFSDSDRIYVPYLGKEYEYNNKIYYDGVGEHKLFVNRFDDDNPYYVFEFDNMLRLGKKTIRDIHVFYDDNYEISKEDIMPYFYMIQDGLDITIHVKTENQGWKIFTGEEKGPFLGFAIRGDASFYETSTVL